MTHDTHDGTSRHDGDAQASDGTAAGDLAADGGEDELVLVPLAVLEGEAVVGGLAELLSTMDVLLLGYHVVPEQTPPDQMRQQFEKQGQKALAELSETFEEAGGTAETRLVFTQDREKTIDRIGEEAGATAVLLPNPVADVDSLLVPLRAEVDAARIARFVATLRGDRDIDVTLFAATKEEDAAAADALVETAAAGLADAGVPDEAVRTETETTATPVEAIIDAAVDHDATVMGEREPDWRSVFFGELEDRVAAESLGPVLVVKHE